MKNEIELKIIALIDKIRPFLISDGGNLEYIKFEDGIVYVRLTGACKDCSMIDITLKDGSVLEQALGDINFQENGSIIDQINKINMKMEEDTSYAPLSAPPI